MQRSIEMLLALVAIAVVVARIDGVAPMTETGLTSIGGRDWCPTNTGVTPFCNPAGAPINCGWPRTYNGYNENWQQQGTHIPVLAGYLSCLDTDPICPQDWVLQECDIDDE